MIIYSGDKDKEYWPETESHDPDSEVDYSIFYFLPEHVTSKAYTKGIDLIIPPVSNGCMYECVSGGITGSTVPVFPTKEGGKFEDGDVTWRTLPLTTRLGYGDTFTSTWTGSTDVILQDDIVVDNKYATVKVVAVPLDTSTFEITNTITIIYATGRTEIRQKTLVIPIKEL